MYKLISQFESRDHEIKVILHNLGALSLLIWQTFQSQLAAVICLPHFISFYDSAECCGFLYFHNVHKSNDLNPIYNRLCNSF